MKASACALTAFSLILPIQAWSDCNARSGAHTTALVELYTSEGCSSCPPADQYLSRLTSTTGFDRAVPLALHVDYWDHIGWKDPYAQPTFSQRQNWLVRTSGARTVYTPHFFAAGAQVRGWPEGLEQAIAQITARPARASLEIHAGSPAPGQLRIDASAAAPSIAEPVDLYLAVTESGLTSQVQAGENRGATLIHDQVVRAWIGPIPLTGGHATARRDVTLPTGTVATNVGVAAFVQNRQTAEVIQAVGARSCAAS